MMTTPNISHAHPRSKSPSDKTEDDRDDAERNDTDPGKVVLVTPVGKILTVFYLHRYRNLMGAKHQIGPLTRNPR
jgi:hypothetical protein